MTPNPNWRVLVHDETDISQVIAIRAKDVDIYPDYIRVVPEKDDNVIVEYWYSWRVVHSIERYKQKRIYP